jgi:hypothetical protein
MKKLPCTCRWMASDPSTQKAGMCLVPSKKSKEFRKEIKRLVIVAHIYNSSYLGDRDGEVYGWREARQS